MLTAYEDGDGFQIKELKDPRISAQPIVNYSNALRILEKAKDQRPDIRWEMVGGGPYSVQERR